MDNTPQSALPVLKLPTPGTGPELPMFRLTRVGSVPRVTPGTSPHPGDDTARGTPAPESPMTAPAWRRRARVGVRVAATLAVVVLLVNERSLIASSFRVISHLKWMWLGLAV